MKPMTSEELEQFIHRELRGLPARHAPASLEGRVLAEIERRAAIAWYHKSWNHWPAAVRALFLAFATAFAGAAIWAGALFLQGVEPAAILTQFGARFSWVVDLYDVAAWAVRFVGNQLAHLPKLWLYSTVAFIAALYATFIGLGATAYRFLYRNQN